MFRDRLSRPPVALLCSSLLETESLIVWQPTNPSDPITATLGSAPDVHTSFPCVLGPNADPYLTHWATSGLCCFLYNVTERRSEITHTAHIQFLLYATVYHNLERQNVFLMRNRRHRILIILHSICLIDIHELHTSKPVLCLQTSQGKHCGQEGTEMLTTATLPQHPNSNAMARWRYPSGQSISQAWQLEFCPQNSYGRRNDSHKLSSDPHTHAVVLYPQKKM